jgi:uncharacterized repeat protein (TIGR03803 family)
MATVTTLYTFGNTGQDPVGGVLIDAAGDLFGTTASGGAGGWGTVFEIPKTSTGYSTLITLASFNLANGATPQGTLIADAAGDLFGTTYGVGAINNSGTVFEILKTSTGYASTPITLASFDASNGAGPIAGLTADPAGNLFGTTAFGGAGGGGTVFEIPKTSTGYGTLNTLANLGGGNGLYPSGTLVVDAAGNLFGTAQNGGANGDGTVFELVRNGGSYTFNTLVNFNYTNGFDPAGGLVLDAAGNLFGTTYSGGAYDQGTVFEIPKTSIGYVSTPITLYNFNGGNGPKASLTIDAVEDLFGITLSGTAFELVNNDGSYTYKSVASGIGGEPQAALAADAFGDLFGTAPKADLLFEITGSGFIATLLPSTEPEAPTLMAPSSRTVTAFGSTQMLITASPIDSDDKLSVTISGVPLFESITVPSGDTVTSQLVHGGGNGDTLTFTISAPVGQSISDLTLNSTFTGKGHPVNTFTVTATNSTSGEAGTSAAKTITVTDPPMTLAEAYNSPADVGPPAPMTPESGHIGNVVSLMTQFMANHTDQAGGAITSPFVPQGGHENSAVLATPHNHAV